MAFDITLNNKFYNAATQTLLVSKQLVTKQTFLGYFHFFLITYQERMREELIGLSGKIF